jgi:hypothetical protein
MAVNVAKSPDEPFHGRIGVRVAGLPTDALEPSRLVHSTELAVGIVRLDREIEQDAVEISAELYQLIGEPGTRALKPTLVGLRRAVHRGVRIDAPLAAPGVPDALGPQLTERIERHLKLRGERAEAVRDLERVEPDELGRAAIALAELLRNADFASGLSHASPDLYEDACRWAARLDGGSGRRALDQAAVRLSKYAARAVAKPSPRSTFASSGFGRWSEVGEEGDAGAGRPEATRLEPAPRRQVVELSLLPLSRIVAALAHLPEFDGVARLRVNPFADAVSTAAGDQLLFTAPGPAGLVRSLALGGPLAALLHAARSARTPADLSAALLEAAGQPSPQNPAVATVHPLVTRLVSAGLLERLLPLPDQELDAATLAAWLDDHAPADGGGERSAGVLRDLHAIVADLERYPGSDPAERGPVARRLHRNTASAARRLGVIDADDELDPRLTFFHNTVLESSAAVLDRSAWQDVVAHLSLVPRLLAPFDTLAPRRRALREHAVDELGEGFHRPLLAFLRDFGPWWEQQDGYQPTARDAERQDAVLRLVGQGPEDAGSVTRLSSEGVRELTDGWIEPHAVRDRFACYVQAFPDASGRMGAVLNTMAGGHGTGRTRTARLLQGAIPDSDEWAPRHPEDGPLYAELDACFGSALNQRTSALPHAIELPASWTGRDRSGRLSPDDLVVTADPAGRRLRLESRRLGREVRPLHLGLLATPLLPLPARLLAEAFGQTSYSFWSDWPQLWPAQSPSPSATAEPGAPSRLPRLALGPVVLRRAAWFLPPGAAPTRDPAHSDASFLVRLHDWRERHAVPMRCFLRVLTGPPIGALSGSAVQDKDRKPLYVDFSHRHLVRVFENAVSAGKPLLLTEALPDLAHAPAYPDGSRHVAEFVIEVAASESGA